MHVGSAGLLDRTAVGLRVIWRTIAPIEDSRDQEKKGEKGSRNRKPRGLVKT